MKLHLRDEFIIYTHTHVLFEEINILSLPPLSNATFINQDQFQFDFEQQFIIYKFQIVGHCNWLEIQNQLNQLQNHQKNE
ncbi:unnamed protein product [Paramecium octaurelia]|uniref:Uncharacterized protein n=1 Tax=Paramecium octaurelia TaxID=43137 RepID=A0A8S1V744_PAROT|nr:unnamed protein product [Paramecium octaurelia]